MIGFWFHGCECCKPRNPSNGYLKQAAKRRAQTKYRDAYTRKLGYEVVVMKECEWKEVDIF